MSLDFTGASRVGVNVINQLKKIKETSQETEDATVSNGAVVIYRIVQL